MNYEFHPDAEQELYETARHYESEVPGLGRLFLDEVIHATQLLLDYNDIGGIDEVSIDVLNRARLGLSIK